MRTAVLVTCHGSVSELDDLPEFLKGIRRGHEAPPAILDEVRRRYARIGSSPLMRITAQQARALEQRLGLPVRVAARLWRPYPREVLAELASEGVERVLSLPLAPQSVHVYHTSVRQAAAALRELTVRYAPSYGSRPEIIDALLETIDEAIARFAYAAPEEVPVVLTAHSLPTRVIAAGDTYEREFRAMAGLVAERLERRGFPTFVAFQSQGMTADPWLGPDLQQVFTELATMGMARVLVAPIGFVAEHVETLYDLDIEARALAHQHGLTHFERASALCDRPRFIDALEILAREGLDELW